MFLSSKILNDAFSSSDEQGDPILYYCWGFVPISQWWWLLIILFPVFGLIIVFFLVLKYKHYYILGFSKTRVVIVRFKGANRIVKEEAKTVFFKDFRSISVVNNKLNIYIKIKLFDNKKIKLFVGKNIKFLDSLHRNDWEKVCEILAKASPEYEQHSFGAQALLKIIIPILIVILVATIGFVKNSQHSFLDKSNLSDTTVATEITNPDFAYSVKGSLDIAKLKSYNLPIIIEFGAEWCEPCKTMAPIVTSLNDELQGKAIVRFVNTDDRVNISESYDFQYIPTQVFINADGTPYNPSNAAAMQMDLHYDKVTGALAYTTHTDTLTKQQLLDILNEMGMK